MNNHENFETERERERERAFNLPRGNKPKSKLWLLAIAGVITLTGVGTLVYFTWPKNPNSTQPTPTNLTQKKQQFQKKLSQFQNHLTTLDQNITQTEADLQTKKTEQVNNSSPSLQTEINQLEQQLTTYKTRKQELAVILVKLKQQINNLDKVDKEVDKNIEQLEKELKQVSQEFGIKEEPEKPNKNPDKLDDKKDEPKNPQPPKEKDDDLPNEDNPKTPDPSNANLQDFLKDLEIVKNFLEAANKHNEANKENLTRNADGTSKYNTDKKKYADGLAEIKQLQSKFTVNSPPSEITQAKTKLRQKYSNLFNPNQKSSAQVDPQVWQTLKSQYSEINTLINKINQDFAEFANKWKSSTQDIRDFVEEMFKDYISVKALMNNFQDPINECLGVGFLTDSQHQIFLSASPQTQKANVELIEASFNASLLEIKRRLSIIFEQMEGVLKWTEEFVKEVKKNTPGLDVSDMDKSINDLKNCFTTRDNLIANFDQKTIVEKIKTVSSLYQALEDIDWKNKGEK